MPQKTSEMEADPEYTLSKSEEVFSAISGVSTMILQALKDAARFTPVPYLSEVSSLALGVVDAFETCKSNKEGFKRLAADCCDLVFAIGTVCGGYMKDGTPLSTELEDHLKLLRRTLRQIIEFTEKQGRRNRISRFLTYRSDSEKIQAYRERLRHAMDLFGLQSDISIHETVKRIAAHQEGPGQRVDSDELSLPNRDNLRVAFPGFTSSSLSGNIKFNNVVGDQSNTNNENHTTNTNSHNVFNTGHYLQTSTSKLS
ncbi:hypothetical protein WG66_017015 [Moniliophthora roreri]|nr:hypothetical protein WG66_017015 [Moniliophthora roreri]